jgi:hypothetical protein
VEEGAEVSGRLELTDGRTISNPEHISVEAEVGSTEQNRQWVGKGSRQVQVDRDGAFVIGGVPSGQARFWVQAHQGRYFLKAVYQGENRVANGLLPVKTGERLANVRLILSDEVGQVRGKLRDQDGPSESFQVVLVPADPSQWDNHRSYRYGWGNGEQPFVLEGVPAGRYLLFAFDSQIGFGGREFVKKHQARALELAVRAGETEDVEVIPMTREELGLP